MRIKEAFWGGKGLIHRLVEKKHISFFRGKRKNGNGVFLLCEKEKKEKKDVKSFRLGPSKEREASKKKLYLWVLVSSSDDVCG